MANYVIIARRETNDSSLAVAVDAVLREHFPGYIVEADADLFVFSTSMPPGQLPQYFQSVEVRLSDVFLIIELGSYSFQFNSGSDFYRELEERLGKP